MAAKILAAETAEEPLHQCQQAEQLILASGLLFWQDKFMQRHAKQLKWEADKRGQQQLKQARLEVQQVQLAGQDKERGQNAAKARRGQTRNQSSASAAATGNSDGN